MIEAEPRVAQQVREQYRFFVVDEYQDVSPLQHDLLELWLGDRDDLCVVGDASQTIYSFAGASPEYLLGFAGEHENAVVLRLEQNYRSAPPIIDAANRLMRGRPGALSLTAASELTGPRPTVNTYDSDSSEARAVAAAIAEEIASGIPPEQIAVLYRINVQSQAIETALGDAGVPCVVRGATRFFDQREVKEALMLLRGATVTTSIEPLFKTVRNGGYQLGVALFAVDPDSYQLLGRHRPLGLGRTLHGFAGGDHGPLHALAQCGYPGLRVQGLQQGPARCCPRLRGLP